MQVQTVPETPLSAYFGSPTLNCGATPEKVEGNIKKNLANPALNGEWPDNTPHLSQDMTIFVVGQPVKKKIGNKEVTSRGAYSSWQDAWEALIKPLQEFRQARSGGAFGRSKWPEAEQVRRITEDRMSKHTENPILLAIESFPRGAFGLPIIFHFKDAEDGDPQDMTLKGGLMIGTTDKYRERLASPLILRPIACGQGKYVGLAAILHTPRQPLEGYCLKGPGVTETVTPQLTKKDALKIEPLKSAANKLLNDNDQIDIIEAFVDSLRLRAATLGNLVKAFIGDRLVRRFILRYVMIAGRNQEYNSLCIARGYCHSICRS